MEEKNINVNDMHEEEAKEEATKEDSENVEHVSGEVEGAPIDWKFVAKEALKVAGGALFGFLVGKSIYGRVRFLTEHFTADTPPIKDPVNKDCVNAYIHSMNEYFNKNDIVFAKDLTKKYCAELDYVK